MEETIGPVDKGERPVGFEPANRVRLVLHHRPQALLTFRHRPLRLPALGGRRGEEHVRDGQDPDIASDQHQAVPFMAGDERSAAAQQGIDGQRRNQQRARGGPALAKPQGAPHQKREGQVSEREVLNPVNKPGMK